MRYRVTGGLPRPYRSLFTDFKGPYIGDHRIGPPRGAAVRLMTQCLDRDETGFG